MNAFNTTPQAAPRFDNQLNRARVAPPPQLASQQICTIGAPDAYRVDYHEICNVPEPETTYHPKTGNAQYQVVPYASLANGARDVMATLLDADPVFETYALGRSGQQMFGMIGFGSEITGQAITVALRSSYDKSISNQVAIGSAPFVCANGCFSGDYMISAKHTTNVFETLGRMINDITQEAVVPVVERMRMIEEWKDIPVVSDLFGTWVFSSVVDWSSLGSSWHRTVTGTTATMVTCMQSTDKTICSVHTRLSLLRVNALHPSMHSSTSLVLTMRQRLSLRLVAPSPMLTSQHSTCASVSTST